MKRKPLWRVSVATTPEAEDAVAEMLGAVLNRAAASYLNAETGMSTVTVYCEARPAADVRKTIVSPACANQKLRVENRLRQNHDCKSAARRLGGIVETAFQAHRNRRRAAGQTKLEQTQAAKKSGRSSFLIPA